MAHVVVSYDHQIQQNQSTIINQQSTIHNLQKALDDANETIIEVVMNELLNQIDK